MFKLSLRCYFELWFKFFGLNLRKNQLKKMSPRGEVVKMAEQKQLKDKK